VESVEQGCAVPPNRRNPPCLDKRRAGSARPAGALVGGVCVPGREERADLLNYFIDSPFVVAKLAPYVEKILVLGHRAHSHDQNFHRRNYENRRWDRSVLPLGC
jgi:hypothetical protein